MMIKESQYENFLYHHQSMDIFGIVWEVVAQELALVIDLIIPRLTNYIYML